MANFDKQYVLLTRELKSIIIEECEKQMRGEQSIFLLRQAGVDEFMYKSSRSREIQHCESLIKRMEIILDKTGILREDCILTVLDTYREMFNIGGKEKYLNQKENEFYIEEKILDIVDPF